jgi:hypothetical protein
MLLDDECRSSCEQALLLSTGANRSVQTVALRCPLKQHTSQLAASLMGGGGDESCPETLRKV